MANQDREHLSHRLDDLRRLLGWTTDKRALAAIIEEIAKHEAALKESDKTAADQNEVVVPKTPRDTIA